MSREDVVVVALPPCAWSISAFERTLRNAVVGDHQTVIVDTADVAYISSEVLSIMDRLGLGHTECLSMEAAFERQDHTLVATARNRDVSGLTPAAFGESLLEAIQDDDQMVIVEGSGLVPLGKELLEVLGWLARILSDRRVMFGLRPPRRSPLPVPSTGGPGAVALEWPDQTTLIVQVRGRIVDGWQLLTLVDATKHADAIVVDLSGVTHISAIGRQCILRGSMRCHIDDVRFVVCASGTTLEAIELAGLDHLVDVVPTREAALRFVEGTGYASRAFFAFARSAW